jgi:hypothetical protein
VRSFKPVAPPKLDEVDRALAGVRTAIGKLARLVAHDDSTVVLKAARLLHDMGQIAARPLASAIPRVPDPSKRMNLLLVLKAVYRSGDEVVVNVLLRLMKRDPDVLVRQMARLVLTAQLEGDFMSMVQQGAERAGTADGPRSGPIAPGSTPPGPGPPGERPARPGTAGRADPDAPPTPNGVRSGPGCPI